MEEQLELGKEVFKALASDTRIDILKALTERRKTLTELAESLNLSKSTAHEHLLKLTEAGLIKKVDSPNKWIYYELTEKGLDLIQPKRKKSVILLLSSALLAFAVGGYQIANYIQMGTQRMLMEAAPQAPGAKEASAVGPVIPASLIVGVILLGVGVFLVLIGRKINRGMFGKNRTFSEA